MYNASIVYPLCAANIFYRVFVCTAGAKQASGKIVPLVTWRGLIETWRVSGSGFPSDNGFNPKEKGWKKWYLIISRSLSWIERFHLWIEGHLSWTEGHQWILPYVTWSGPIFPSVLRQEEELQWKWWFHCLNLVVQQQQKFEFPSKQITFGICGVKSATSLI